MENKLNVLLFSGYCKLLQRGHQKELHQPVSKAMTKRLSPHFGIAFKVPTSDCQTITCI